ncbi:DUF2993 domain-containing protein [Gordonia alkaliphila]|uniref:LmeA family phospholipid-binding protein n=1 Tax=Gordonia alkaliphila TaxID=1053547 RepID=UPI001FF40BF1|nr:LmeA family phospholipid-binding protein [Gordonia alkaliphila]MCK0438676.1 DUF2993 domain-containing protein [Gordonia alkaliphila]
MSDEKPDADKPDAETPDAAASDAAASDVEIPAPESAAAETAEAENPVSAGSEPTTSLSEPTTDSLPVVPPPPAVGLPGTRPVTQQMPAADLGAGEFEEFAQASGPSSTVVRSSPRRSRLGKSRGRTIGLVATALVLLVIIAGVSTELYVRNRVTGCLEDAFGNLTGTSTSVSVPRGPMLAAWFTGSVAWVQIDTNDSSSGTAMRLHARADDVARDGRSVKSLRGSAFIPYDRVQEMAADNGSGQQTSGAEIQSVTGNADGTMTIDASYPVAFFSVPATVVIRPTQVDGKVEFRVEETTAFGIGLPNDFAQEMVDQVTDAMLGPLFAEISVDDLKVSDRGIEVTFSGQDVNLQAASAVTGGQTTCT